LWFSRNTGDQDQLATIFAILSDDAEVRDFCRSVAYSSERGNHYGHHSAQNYRFFSHLINLNQRLRLSSFERATRRLGALAENMGLIRTSLPHWPDHILS
jgi:hypothetical protein